MLTQTKHYIPTYQSPDIESIKRKRGSQIFQSYKKRNQSLLNEDPKLEELKKEQQALKIKSMVNGSSNVTSFKIANMMTKMRKQLQNLSKDDLELKLLNTYIHQYNQMLSLDGGSKKRGNLSISIDSTNYYRSKQIVERNVNTLGFLYKEIKGRTKMKKETRRKKLNQQCLSSDKTYRVRHSSYIPSLQSRVISDNFAPKTPIKQKMESCITEISKNCSRMLEKNKKLRVIATCANEKLKSTFSVCNDTITNLEKENRRGDIFIKFSRKIT